MKKISLMVACAGLISAATFANGRLPINTPQVGSKAQKTEKAQPASTPKTEKAAPTVKKAEAASEKAEVKQNAQPERATQEQPAKASTAPKNKPVKKMGVAKGVMTATPVPVEQKKK